jgi:hypothetical protein
VAQQILTLNTQEIDPWKFTPQRLPEKIEAQVFKKEFGDEKAINNLQFILKDIMQGDNALRDRPEYAHLNFPAIKAALSWLIENNQMDESLKVMLLNEPWKMNFKQRPPTPVELLDEKYLGPMIENLWRPIRRNFIDFFDPLKSWRTAIFCSSIGSGKSTLVCLIYAYIAICFALMWSPHKFFSKMSTSIFALVFCAVSMKKGSEVYLEPIIQLFESSPFFERVRTHGEMKEAEIEYLKRDTIDRIVWTSSTPSAQPLDSKIYLPDGSYKLIGNAQIGDIIESPTEGITEIVGIPYEGEDDCYEIEFETGQKTRCSWDHKWKVSWRSYLSGEKIWEVVNTKFIIDHPELDIDFYDFNSIKHTN